MHSYKNASRRHRPRASDEEGTETKNDETKKRDAHHAPTNATPFARDRHDLGARVNKPPPPRRRRWRRNDDAPAKVTNQRALITPGCWEGARIRLSIGTCPRRFLAGRTNTIRSDFNRRSHDSDTITIDSRNFSAIISCNARNVIEKTLSRVQSL